MVALEKAAAAGAKLYVSEEAPARNITTAGLALVRAATCSRRALATWRIP